jgi:predicted nucleotidyltransferase/DNA-binding XRE family transcriptional regulator
MTNEDIATLIRNLRRRLDLTQEQFAQKVGVTYSTVNHWENGKRAPQPFLLRRLLQMEQQIDVQTVSSSTDRPTARAQDPGDSRAIPGTAARSADKKVRREIREMVKRIVERFHPEKIILFGSHARGEATPDSDVDMLVIMRVEGSKREAQLRVREAIHDIRIPKDVIVTTPEEFNWRQRIVGTIERPAAREGKVLYARG